MIFAASWMMTACEKDGETLVVTAPEGASELSADATEIVLTANDVENLALTLYWNNGQSPAVSNPNVSLPDDLMSLTLQMSAEETFALPYEQMLESGQSSVQFTVAALNNIMLRLGFTEARLYDVYVRVNTRMSSEVSSSETLKLRIAPFIIDMSVMEMQTTDFASTFATLHCGTDTPTLFEGFAVTSAGWYNFYFVSADGTIWGNDGDTGVAFEISTAETKWNCWFAGTTGCHYVFMDTQLREWWQVHLPSMELVVGGEHIEMQFSTKTKTWTGVFTTSTDNAALTIGGTGARYDKTVGTESDATPIDYPYSIVADGQGTFRFVEGSAGTALTAGQAGTYTLTLDVENATCELSEGSGGGGDDDPIVTYPEALYAFYYYKEASQRLDLATAMAATEEEGSYQGFIYTDPDWGAEKSNFRFLTAMDDTATVYATNSGQYELTTDDSAWNLWSSNTGLNYVVADLATMSWSETKVSQIAVSGDFNGWSTSSDMLVYDAATGKWTATCEIQVIEYGFKIVLGDAENAWRWQYGDPDGDGVLQVAGNNDNIVPAATGTYKIELELNSFAAPVYTLTLQ